MKSEFKGNDLTQCNHTSINLSYSQETIAIEIILCNSIRGPAFTTQFVKLFLIIFAISLVGYTANVSLSNNPASHCLNTTYFQPNGTKFIDQSRPISFELFMRTQFQIVMDSAETKDWIDFVISVSDINIQHPFDLLYLNQKLVLSATKSMVKRPQDLKKEDGFLFYLNTLNSTYRTVVFTMAMKKDPCCSILNKNVLKKRWSYVWHKELHLSKKVPGYLISLPDFQYSPGTSVSIKRHGINISSISTLKLYWMDIHYYEAFFHQPSRFKYKNPFWWCGRGVNEVPFINYSHVMTKYKNLNKDYYYMYYMTRPGSKVKLSWNEAMTFCETFGGTLPIIRSKQHQEEILSFLASKFSPPPIIVLFIGLTTSHYSQEVRDSGVIHKLRLKN